MIIKLLIISILILAVAGAGMALTILLKPGGKFPDTHISSNKEMRKRGIKCAQHTDTGCNSSADFTGCSSCGSRLIGSRN